MDPTSKYSMGFVFIGTETISVITNDGRHIVGILKGFDQATNIILDESHERVYSTKNRGYFDCHSTFSVFKLIILVFWIAVDSNSGIQIRSVVGELDEELDANLDLSKLRAHPLKPVIH
ncbi:Sm-like protein LSM8 [Cocos nucifera]|uniref:U6 snRNA-associated Sm-like protein LSm8 n=1 Tax=Cocos nucifera TaxID=13894 RepID=A0A8K0IBI3_COCNU|nr:Sm-like protein LSM8 [Cocos nucifera]